MSLAALQIAFREELVGADDGAAPSSHGMAIYRDAYRGRLLAALESCYERTRRWTGEAAFRAAACHYILTHSPTSWTLDSYGAEFPQLLAELFTNDTEVAELAWMEWQMSQAFAAPDRPTFDAGEFAATSVSDIDWNRITFTMAAGFALRPISTNCVVLWEAMSDPQGDAPDVEIIEPAWLLIWRSRLLPRYRTITGPEAEALGILGRSAPMCALALEHDVSELGTWLAQWFADGLFAKALELRSIAE